MWTALALALPSSRSLFVIRCQWGLRLPQLIGWGHSWCLWTCSRLCWCNHRDGITFNPPNCSNNSSFLSCSAFLIGMKQRCDPLKCSKCFSDPNRRKEWSCFSFHFQMLTSFTYVGRLVAFESHPYFLHAPQKKQHKTIRYRIWRYNFAVWIQLWIWLSLVLHWWRHWK